MSQQAQPDLAQQQVQQQAQQPVNQQVQQQAQQPMDDDGNQGEEFSVRIREIYKFIEQLANCPVGMERDEKFQCPQNPKPEYRDRLFKQFTKSRNKARQELLNILPILKSANAKFQKTRKKQHQHLTVKRRVKDIAQRTEQIRQARTEASQIVRNTTGTTTPWHNWDNLTKMPALTTSLGTMSILSK